MSAPKATRPPLGLHPTGAHQALQRLGLPLSLLEDPRSRTLIRGVLNFVAPRLGLSMAVPGHSLPLVI